MRARYLAWMAAIMLLGALREARGQVSLGDAPDDDTVTPVLSDRLELTPPAWLSDDPPRASAIDLGLRGPSGRSHQALHLTLDQSATVLHLAVHGDGRPGLAPFLGTSTASLGGFRLRF